MPDKKMTIVGIGASAGGLDAFEKLLKNAPIDSGMAFVLIQHLDPGHDSILVDLLQRSTLMPVVEVRDQMRVAANQVHVIPPNHDMTIEQGVLHLNTKQQPRGKTLTIDSFFYSLAADQGEHAVGIVLSGTGSDGTLGLKSIQQSGGITVVQEPTTAQYDGMPKSVIASMEEVKILKPEKMLTSIATIIASKQNEKNKNMEEQKCDEADVFQILMLLRNASGHDFSEYKKSTIRRRIERRMLHHDIKDLKSYAMYLKNAEDEIPLLLNELLINVTSFFRDPQAFEMLKKEVIPMLFKGKLASEAIRVWVVGCATGEEAYSVAILLREHMDEMGKEYRVQLYATDLDQEAISIARTGVYAASIKKDITPSRVEKYFHDDQGGLRVNKQIRDMVVFAVQNVIKDPPLIKLDLLCCRNLLIYLEPQLQSRLVTTFHFCLRPGGVLFLSPAESISNHTDLFNLLDRKFKFYQVHKSLKPVSTIYKKEGDWLRAKEKDINQKIEKVEEALAPTSKLSPKASHEQLQSINDELQSANEELETSKEELQSVNEELVTVNAELQVKIDQLAGIQNDMKNLLDNMNIGTIFLDENLIIRRFTREAVRAYRLIDADIGRPLQDIASNLIHVDLLDYARQVLATHEPFEIELSTRIGAWYLVHIQPYRTLDDVTKGIVMTFTDITKRVQAENETQLAKTLAEGIVDTVLEPLVVLNANLKVQSASRAFYHFFKVTPESTINQLIYELGNRQWDIPSLRSLLETILPEHQHFEGYIVEHDFQDIGRKKMLLNARTIVDKHGETQLILFAMQSI